MTTNSNGKILSSWIVRGLGVLMALSLVIASLPRSVSAAPPTAKEECNFFHAVRRGDTLRKIESRYGYSAAQIVARNDLKKPYTIYVGQNLCIPSKVKKNVPDVASKYTNKPAVFFTAGRDGKDILVYTYNYPKTTALVKTAIFGGDPNWGRILQTLGAGRVELCLERTVVKLCGVTVFRRGASAGPGARKRAAVRLGAKEVGIEVSLGVGRATARVWTCDLSYDYVKCNI